MTAVHSTKADRARDRSRMAKTTL